MNSREYRAWQALAETPATTGVDYTTYNRRKANEPNQASNANQHDRYGINHVQRNAVGKRRGSHILHTKGRENMIKTAIAVIGCTVLVAMLAVVALDAWQYEYFGDCDGCIVLDTLRPGLDR